MNEKPPCGWLVDDEGTTCKRPSITEVTVKSRVGGGKVPVCHEHKAAFNQKAAALRTTVKSK